MRTIEVVFWIFLFMVFYTYLGYGVLLYFLVRIKEFFINPATIKLPVESEFPETTLLIAAYNEEDIVREKMANTLMLDYLPEKLKVVWVTDGSSDRTNEILAEYENLTVLYEAKRSGKTAAINRAMTFVKTPIVIFTDANTMLNREAVKEIVKAFSDINVGCVAGEKRIIRINKDNISSGGEGIYWKYESALKSLDSRLNTTCGAAGELYAIRRELYMDLETDTLLDDFILSMRIAEKGYRIHYCSSAYAIEDGSCSIAEEKKRKIRIAAGGVQSVLRLRGLLNPFKHPLLSFQYISHRVFRWTITPLMFFFLLPLNVLIVISGSSWMYSVLFILQIFFYLMAIIGMTVPYYFLFMNVSVIKGFRYLIKKGKGDGTWEKSKRDTNKLKNL